MSEEQNIHDLIDQYLKDELGRDEMDRFRNRMRNDAEFAREVELHRAVVEEIKEARKAELKEYLKANAKVEYIGNIWSTRWVYASAAVIVFMVGLYFVLTNMIDQPQIADQVESKDKQEVTRQDKRSRTPVIKPQTGDDEQEADDQEQAEPAEDIQTPPEIEIVEDDAESVNIGELAREEKLLEAENYKVAEEELLGSQVKPLYVIKTQESPVTISKEEIQERNATSVATEVESVDKKRGLFGRNKDKADDAVKTEDEETTSKSYANTYDNSPSKSKYVVEQSTVKVEFWKSPVKFSGFNFDGKTIQLYGIDKSEWNSITFKSYNGDVYMLRKGMYYWMIPTGQSMKFEVLTDQSKIDILNQK